MIFIFSLFFVVLFGSEIDDKFKNIVWNNLVGLVAKWEVFCIVEFKLFGN